MAVFKCKMCGGDLNLTPNTTIAECEYCFTKQTVPYLDDEKRLNLFNRANRLRINGEFDAAANVYENIVAEFPEEAEGYWGLVICNYGIEYVDDPLTAKKIPTCHRASFDTVTENENYLLALKHADGAAKDIYRSEAEQIERLRRDILHLSQNEQPYDIFICYKETDGDGNRTMDSVIAQTVYDELCDKGYRVFFARVTLEDKLGSEFEPYIFAALNSAKVMLAFGTKREYFISPWVKNEWGRFLGLIQKDKSKAIIPCYKDMDPYDMPDEFKVLQAQNMGEIGAMQDLLRGIEKLFPEKNGAVAEHNSSEIKNTALESLVQCVIMFLEDKRWSDADEFCEKILDIDPENAFAYLGKLMVELQLPHQDDLAKCDTSFEHMANYKKALRFADERLANTLKGYVATVTESGGDTRLEGIYTEAQNALINSESIEDLHHAVDLFKSISGYKDADSKKIECYEKIDKLKAREKEKAIQKERQAYKERKARSKRSLIIKIIAVVLVVALFVSTLLYFQLSPSARYKDAKEFMSDNHYEAALKILKDLDYKDSAILAEQCEKIIWYSENTYNAAVGDIVVFGSYEQDNNIENGAEPLEWIILENNYSGMVLISRYVIDCQIYYKNYLKENMNLWLAQSFCYSAFTDYENKVLKELGYVPIDGNTQVISKAQLLDRDDVFSLLKAADYTEENERLNSCRPTAYAESLNTDFLDKKSPYCYWWLDGGSYVGPDGYVHDSAEYGVSMGVRPLITIDLNKIR